MDSGVAIAVLIIYFTLQYPANGSIGENTIQSWWGNTVFKNTLDAKAASYYPTVNVTFGYALGSLLDTLRCSCCRFTGRSIGSMTCVPSVNTSSRPSISLYWSFIAPRIPITLIC